MSSTENEFFNGKRPWSRLKDEVLKNYLGPYLKKVNYLKKNIILVDSFAGPGTFEDGEKGSPFIICELAEQNVPENYLAILVNKEAQHHNALIKTLESFIKSKKAFAMHGSADELLKSLLPILTDQTLFIYLDPFGLKDTDFGTIQEYLNRNKNYSTELLINLSVPTILRNSCVNAYNRKGLTPEIEQKQKVLDKALGGDYWRGYLLNPHLSTEERILNLLQEYTNRIKKELEYCGYCLVYEKLEKSRIKYAIVFASRHLDAQILMNDIMFKAYRKHIWNNYSKETLFSELDWTEGLPESYYIELEKEILVTLDHSEISRKDLWLKIISNNFMRFQHKDFRNKLRQLVGEKINFKDIRGTGKLNDDSIIFRIQ